MQLARPQAAIPEHSFPGLELGGHEFRKMDGRWKRVTASHQKLNGIVTDGSE
jgi:hypothetical protein